MTWTDGRANSAAVPPPVPAEGGLAIVSSRYAPVVYGDIASDVFGRRDRAPGRRVVTALLCVVALLGAIFAAVVADSALARATPAWGATPATAPRAAGWTVDWAQGITFGTVGNVGPHAVADCAIAAVADIEQVLHRVASPEAPAPYLAAYRTLAVAEGAAPGSGLVPAAVLAAWRTTGIAGTRITSSIPIGTTRAVVEHALARGPVYAVLELPPSTSDAPSYIDASGVAVTPWSATAPPSGYAGGGTHVVAVVGYGSNDVLVATWGYIQTVSWSLWEHMATAAWTIAR